MDLKEAKKLKKDIDSQPVFLRVGQSAIIKQGNWKQEEREGKFGKYPVFLLPAMIEGKERVVQVNKYQLSDIVQIFEQLNDPAQVSYTRLR